jgi:hypothetical protein
MCTPVCRAGGLQRVPSVAGGLGTGPDPLHPMRFVRGGNCGVIRSRRQPSHRSCTVCLVWAQREATVRFHPLSVNRSVSSVRRHSRARPHLLSCVRSGIERESGVCVGDYSNATPVAEGERSGPGFIPLGMRGCQRCALYRPLRLTERFRSASRRRQRGGCVRFCWVCAQGVHTLAAGAYGRVQKRGVRR